MLFHTDKDRYSIDCVEILVTDETTRVYDDVLKGIFDLFHGLEFIHGCFYILIKSDQHI